MLKFLTGALALFVLVGLAACGEEVDPGQIEVADLRLVRQNDGYPEVSGLLINRTPERISSADVGVKLFDERNLQMSASARLVVRDVAPGDSARFRQRLDVDARGASLDYVLPNF